MPGKSNTFENDILKLIFNATTIANVANNASASPATNLYVSLHTADPGETGVQSTSECNYTGYARVAVVRSASGWTVTGSSVSPAANIVFPECTGGTNTVTHWAIGLSSSGSGYLLYAGTVTPNIAVVSGVTPILTTSSAVTED